MPEKKHKERKRMRAPAQCRLLLKFLTFRWTIALQLQIDLGHPRVESGIRSRRGT